MDVDVQDVASAVAQANGLLLLPVDVDFLQSSELPDAVVDVHHVVARLKSGEFLEGQGLLALLEAFLQPESVVAFEQLVVGVDQQLELFVYKALAQLDGNGMVRHFSFAVGENVVQPLDLRGLSGDDDVVVALPVVGLQVGGDQVEVLVEARLLDHVPVDDHPIRKRGAAVELHDVEGFEQAFQPFGRDEQGFRRGEFDRIRNALKGAHRALHGLFQLAFGTLGIGHPNARVGRDKVEQRLDGFVEALVADVGHDHRSGHLVDTELGDGIKLPDGVHFVTKEFDAVRMVKRVGKHIDNAPAHRVLPGLVDKINLAKPVLDEHLVQEVHGVLLAQGQGEGLFG